MFGKQAKVLSGRNVRKLLVVAGRGRLILLLAVHAGLRACEIARLTWGMVLDADRCVGHVIDVRGSIAKRGAGRRIPMHSNVRRSTKAASWWTKTLARAMSAS